MLGPLIAPINAGTLSEGQSVRAVAGPPERGKGDNSFAAIFGQVEAAPAEAVVDLEVLVDLEAVVEHEAAEGVAEVEDATQDAEPEGDRVSDAPIATGAVMLAGDDTDSEIKLPLPLELQGAATVPFPTASAGQVGEESGAPDISGTQVPAMLALTSDMAPVVDRARDLDMGPVSKGAGLNAAAMVPAPSVAAGVVPIAAKSTLEQPKAVAVQPPNLRATDMPITDAKRSADAGATSQIAVPAPQMTSSQQRPQPQPILSAMPGPELTVTAAQAAPKLGGVQQTASSAEAMTVVVRPTEAMLVRPSPDEAMPVRVTQTGSVPLSTPTAPVLQPETRFSYPIDTRMQVGAAQPDMGVALATPTPTLLQHKPVALSAAMIASPAGADNPERGLGLEAVGGAAELRGTLSANAELRPAALTPSTQVETPRQVAVQIADAVRSGEKPIELKLNPAELGRVRLALAPGDGVMMVTVLADRPETLDLMRRHIDMLAQELRAIGYGSTAFSFGQGGDGTASEGFAPGGGGDSDTQDTASGIPEIPASDAPLGVQDRLDIRL